MLQIAAQNLYSLVLPGEDPCSRENAQKHIESLTSAMSESLSAGSVLPFAQILRAVAVLLL